MGTRYKTILVVLIVASVTALIVAMIGLLGSGGSRAETARGPGIVEPEAGRSELGQGEPLPRLERVEASGDEAHDDGLASSQPTEQGENSTAVRQVSADPWTDEVETAGEAWYREERKREIVLLRTDLHRIEHDPTLNPDAVPLTTEEREWLREIVNQMQPKYKEFWEAEGFRLLDLTRAKHIAGQNELVAMPENPSKEMMLTGLPPDYPGQSVGAAWTGGELYMARVDAGEDGRLDQLRREKEELGEQYLHILKAFFAQPGPPEDFLE